MFSIVIKETKEFLREKTSLFFYIMFPIILIFLLGNLLGSIDKADQTIGEIKVQYLLETDDQFQVNAVQGFMDSVSKSNSLLTFEKAENLETAKKLAGDDKITAVVVFSGNPMTIKIYEGKDKIKNRAVSAVLNGFIQTDKSIMTVMESNPQALAGLDNKPTDFVQQKDLGMKRTMMDYYAVTMIAMICFMSTLLGAIAFMNERKNKTINRLIAVPQKRILIFLQKILGMFPPALLQILIIMLVSVFIFKANYAVSFQANILLFSMFVLVTLSCISVGAIIGMIVKRNPMLFVFPVVFTMMFFGGTNSKEIYIKGFSDALPIYQVQQAAFDLTVFGKYDRLSYVILGCLAVMAIALVTGAIIFSRKGEER